MSADFFEAMAEASRAARLARQDKPPRTLAEPCRCGWRDEKPNAPTPRKPGPVTDLTGEDVAVEVTDSQRSCASCAHPIPTGSPVVRHYYGGAAFLHWYHPVCVTGVLP